MDRDRDGGKTVAGAGGRPAGRKCASSWRGHGPGPDRGPAWRCSPNGRDRGQRAAPEPSPSSLWGTGSTGKECSTLKGMEGGVGNAIAFTPDGRRWPSGGEEDQLNFGLGGDPVVFGPKRLALPFKGGTGAAVRGADGL